MSALNPTIHLNRAWGLIQGVNNQLDQLRQHALAHQANLNQDQPILASWATAFQGSRRLGAERSSLHADLQLASSELDRAAALDPDAVIETADGVYGIQQLRGLIFLNGGVVELTAGSSDTAKHLLLQSLQVIETPNAYYMLGLIHEDRYDPQGALGYFEKCLALDPDGEFSVEALREANRMRNYRKKFRGDWFLLLVIIFFCFPLAPVYFIAKYK